MVPVRQPDGGSNLAEEQPKNNGSKQKEPSAWY